MKTIKIFLASSEELDYDRMAFGNLVRRLDDMYEKRGIRIKLFEWEDYDSAYNDKRKQDEYNDYVRQSDIFLALFHKKAGQFTVEEFDIASKEFKDHASPKVYTYCKDLKPGEEETPELKEFKKRLFDEMGHYWCRYDNRESLQFQFVMQLQLVERSQIDEVKVENGIITINGLPVAKIDKLKFAACNEKYQEMNKKLASFPYKIAKARLRLEHHPDDEDLKNDLQEINKEFEQLKKEFAELQQNFFDTAKRVAQLQGEHITNRLRDAINAFNEGRVHDCNLMLDIAQEEARRDYYDFKQTVKIAEVKRQNVISHITEKLFHASSTLADAIIPIEERIKKAEELYEEAYLMADDKNVNYPEEDFADLLFRYSRFLYLHGRYEKAIVLYDRLIKIKGEVWTQELEVPYRDIADSCFKLGYYEKSLNFLLKSVCNQEIILGEEDSRTKITYHWIGRIYSILGHYDKALEYYLKLLKCEEKIFNRNTDYPIAGLLGEIGKTYNNLKNYEKALEFYLNVSSLYERVFGAENSWTAWAYKDIAWTYHLAGKYEKALPWAEKAASASPYYESIGPIDTLATVYQDLGRFNEALEKFELCLKLQHEENASEKSIIETEKKIATIKELLKER